MNRITGPSILEPISFLSLSPSLAANNARVSNAITTIYFRERWYNYHHYPPAPALEPPDCTSQCGPNHVNQTRMMMRERCLGTIDATKLTRDGVLIVPWYCRCTAIWQAPVTSRGRHWFTRPVQHTDWKRERGCNAIDIKVVLCSVPGYEYDLLLMSLHKTRGSHDCSAL